MGFDYSIRPGDLLGMTAEQYLELAKDYDELTAARKKAANGD